MLRSDGMVVATTPGSELWRRGKRGPDDSWVASPDLIRAPFAMTIAGSTPMQFALDGRTAHFANEAFRLACYAALRYALTGRASAFPRRMPGALHTII